MKANFKPMGIAAAVATAAVAYAGAANADPKLTERALGNLGDTAIIPYYTVQEDWVTGVHIINSGPRTQVVKLRMRRATDSADALDINLIMSPYDEWVGSIDDSSGRIVLAAGENSYGVPDTTCTSPNSLDKRFTMAEIYAEGAEEGYIEVIGMGSPLAETYPLAVSAKHNDATGVPASCTGVDQNFFINTQLTPAQGDGGASTYNPSGIGHVAQNQTHQQVPNVALFGGTAGGCTGDTGPGVCPTFYEAATADLKVSYFVRDAISGIEFGGSAVHLRGFNQGKPWMTNQVQGLDAGDPFGYDYPDLNGGPWVVSGLTPTGPTTGTATADEGADRIADSVFNTLRDPSILGVSSLLNDWSTVSARNVSTDWVVTMPGQYAMLDYYVWAGQGLQSATCGRPGIPGLQSAVPACDFRDLPVLANITYYDREEKTLAPGVRPPVVSPTPPTESVDIIFPNEVNVVEWTDGTNLPVLNTANPTVIDVVPLDLGNSGWASLSVSTATGTRGLLCQYNVTEGNANPSLNPAAAVYSSPAPRSMEACTVPAEGATPIVGFVAWERSFPSNPEGNYGRLIDHSFVGS